MLELIGCFFLGAVIIVVCFGVMFVGIYVLTEALSRAPDWTQTVGMVLGAVFIGALLIAGATVIGCSILHPNPTKSVSTMHRTKTTTSIVPREDALGWKTVTE